MRVNRYLLYVVLVFGVYPVKENVSSLENNGKIHNLWNTSLGTGHKSKPEMAIALVIDFLF